MQQLNLKRFLGDLACFGSGSVLAHLEQPCQLIHMHIWVLATHIHSDQPNHTLVLQTQYSRQLRQHICQISELQHHKYACKQVGR